MANCFVLCALFLTVAVLVCSAQEEQDISVRNLKQKRKVQDTCQGLPGLPGRDGRDGRDAGLMGSSGKRGPRGPRGQAGKSGGVTGGAVYTRWGRKTCSNKTTQLYSGK
ncbi:Hypothetical predicted protein [Paramuricea clavata]|uniref:Uncharacterized protein n=1 Tax=Paramuricea clavata TaxID=317549 RepID=A0A6S7JTK5_PARCT|nr:Hypothetical predicted protein [Paramuricea clavata]